MTAPAPIPSSSLHDPWLLSALGWQHYFQQSAMEIQHAQQQFLDAWSKAAFGLYEEACDSWRARFAGGVPLDG